MAEPRRVVILGKTGTGKSSTANTIFGETVFQVNHTSESETSRCQAETRTTRRGRFTLIDTPGFFDTNISEEDLKPEIIKCVTESAPGVHAFLILLTAEKYTEHELDVITKIKESFGEEAFKYSTVVFTHGDQLQEGWKIKDFIGKNQSLRELIEKCGGRCHVIDNKYWKEKPVDEYRSNKFQVEQLLQTIDKMIKDNNDGYYTNEMLQEVEEKIRQEMREIEKSSGSISKEEVREKAKKRVGTKLLSLLAGASVGVLVGAFLGAAMMVMVGFTKKSPLAMSCKSLMAAAAVGAVIGGSAGFVAADCAATPSEGAVMGAKAAYNEVVDVTAQLSGLQIKKLK